MNALIWIVGIVVGVATFLFLAGLFLPQTRSLTREVTIKATRYKVWDVITDFAFQAQWRKSPNRVEMLDTAARQEKWREYPNQGRPFRSTSCQVAHPNCSTSGSGTVLTAGGRVNSPKRRVALSFVSLTCQNPESFAPGNFAGTVRPRRVYGDVRNRTQGTR